MRSAPSSPLRRGFTLIELLLVIAVIALLAGIALPTWGYIAQQSKINSSRAIVDGLVTAIQSQDKSIIHVPVASGSKATPHRLWDLDANGLIDGRPDLDPGFDETIDPADPAMPTGSTYRDLAETLNYGGIHDLELTYRQTMLDQSTGRLVDAWGQPLHIDFHPAKYGATGIGIWSDGPDASIDTDDITSWESQP